MIAWDGSNDRDHDQREMLCMNRCLLLFKGKDQRRRRAKRERKEPGTLLVKGSCFLTKYHARRKGQLQAQVLAREVWLPGHIWDGRRKKWRPRYMGVERDCALFSRKVTSHCIKVASLTTPILAPSISNKHEILLGTRGRAGLGDRATGRLAAMPRASCRHTCRDRKSLECMPHDTIPWCCAHREEASHPHGKPHVSRGKTSSKKKVRRFTVLT